ncbi:uncharacterized protein LOC116853345 [Odontomachus brunneus]|uniref:uncharacterized protein LOC116853345 n=1 Tax=Odontomachus brunneus TaxID=486640 RepID=UPI0013F1957B|nr:uncharacterized protein LOC116853345 [Odontomachus brunneus]
MDCKAFLKSIGFELFVPVFKGNGITINDIPCLFENNAKYLKKIMPKTVDRMNFEKMSLSLSCKQDNIVDQIIFDNKRRKIESNLTSGDPTINTNRFHYLADEIVKLFPGEIKETYYIPSYEM